MKKVYEAPILEIELYELDASIASNCNITVDMGPEGPGAEKVCDDYYEKSGEPKPESSTFSLKPNVDFWTAATCDCYTSASGAYFTS